MSQSAQPLLQQIMLPYQRDSQFYFSRLRVLGDGVWLDSCQPKSPSGRYDILAAAPQAVIEYQRGTLTRTDANGTQHLAGNPFKALQRLLAEYPAIDNHELPFCGGLIGHWGYDLGRALENLPARAEDDIPFPEMRVGYYPWAIITDHQQHTSTLVAQAHIDVQPILAHLETDSAEPAPFRLTRNFTSNMDRAGYHQAMQAIDDYIHAGDCYQVNFAQRFNAEYAGDPLAAYLTLREHAPTPFAAYLESAVGQVLSLSPERFLEVNDNKASTKPIKGTRPRGRNAEEDAAMIADLTASEKDRAENLMIVDLLRNDLSKVCKFGSVKVPKLFDLESYANVHHLVTTVTGELDDNQQALDLLEHCFPGGSITGAPKIRAMEIIDELEPHRRNIYCGSIGYISQCGRMDTSITIRTLLCHEGNIYCWAGGGIVADSEPDDEYQETFNKVGNLLRGLEQ